MREFEMPARRAERRRVHFRKAPSAPLGPVDKAALVVLAVALASAMWGYGCAYQEGYDRGVHYATEVMPRG